MWLSFHLRKLDKNAQPFRDRFINSLCQRKPKKYLLKTRSELFLCLTLLIMHL